MLSDEQRQQALCCAENIALLSILSPPSYAPLINRPPYSESPPNPGRVLSFEAEVSLASTLAFLSAISDDPNHVVAVCVEELSKHKGVRVVVAINKECPESAEVKLGKIRDGLQKILKCLSRALTDSNNQVQYQVLTAILNMSQHRLFSRLGVQRAGVQNTKEKTFFGSPIQQIIDAVSQHSFPKKRQAEAKSFINLALGLVNHLEQLKTCNITTLTGRLRRIVQTASQLRESTKFDSLFSGLDIHPTTKTGFVTRLSKIARYYESSHFLIQLAKRSMLFQHTEVMTVSLDSEVFLRNPNTEGVNRLSECLVRCHDGGPLPLNVKKICQRVKTDPTTADAVLKKTAKKVLTESKVHAEVQIVTHYELHPVPRKPRVICSNKDACYLCNLFIQVHGMFYVPKSHGRLYTGWRVPPIPSLNNVHTQFDKALQNQIRNVVQELKDFPDRERVLDLNQNESTICLFSTLMSSLEGVAAPTVPAPQASPVQKLHQPPGQLPGQLFGESPGRRPKILPDQPPATPGPSKSRLAQPNDSPVDSRDEKIPDQPPTRESSSTLLESPTRAIFSPMPVVSPPEALQSPPTPPESPPESAEVTSTALKTSSLPDERFPALTDNISQPVDQLKKPATMKQDSSHNPAGKPPQRLSRIVLPPLRPEPEVINKGRKYRQGKIMLCRGKTTCVRMDRWGAGAPPPVYTTGKLDIFLDVIAEEERRKGVKRGSRVVEVNITWLDEEELERRGEVDGGSGDVVYLEKGGRLWLLMFLGRGGRGGGGLGWVRGLV
ncbi:hypothetical protein B0T21DRAFT_419999 [Apiosordaria backusii]|uniref:Uncharacterized protein n=1 Tax=Apiosordaria backusii TaxID=314023 RepID=A0AA40EZN5_9PEZI|nr:hypothetical protein B0T21DRAFT_419999 [Apiosordaria backusii]